MRNYVLGIVRKFTRPFRRQKSPAWFVVFGLWLCVFVYVCRNPRNESLEQQILRHYASSPKFGPPKTVIHAAIEHWHRNDKVVPRLSGISAPEWLRYPGERLFRWEDPDPVPDKPGSPGNLGAPVEKSVVSAKAASAAFNKHQLNTVVSDLVPLDRALKDYRNPSCLSLTYPSQLPQASVIIIFNQEAMSTVLRTVHSIINRSPKSLLREVLLVNDKSESIDSSTLESSIRSLPVPVHLINLPERSGLIRARIAGANRASGSVLIFLDAHIEATVGWLEPLLAEISEDRTRVMMPVVDDIDSETFEFTPQESDRFRGGFDWKLLHAWIAKQELMPRQEETDSVPMPIMIGCAFAIDKEYFFASGSFDEKMEIWGGENVELSVRIWRCGGSLLQAPCSRVGHVFRAKTPHSFPGGVWSKLELLHINTGRFAKVWMDEYYDFYLYQNPPARRVDLGDLTSREALKTQCHSFQWYLDHVYPDAPLPTKNHHYVGQVREVSSGKCLDALGSKSPGGMRTCHGLGGFQTILYSGLNELRTGPRCLEPRTTNDSMAVLTSDELRFEPCDLSIKQQWTYNENGNFVNAATGLCLTYADDKKGRKTSGEEGRKTSGEEGRKEVDVGGKGAARTEASFLLFLATVAQEATSTETQLFIRECNSKTGQKWVMDLKAEWKDFRKNMSKFKDTEI